MGSKENNTVKDTSINTLHTFFLSFLPIPQLNPLSILFHRNEVDYQVRIVDIDYGLGLAVDNIYNAFNPKSSTNKVLIPIELDWNMASLR